MPRLSVRGGRKESCGGGEWNRREQRVVVKAEKWSGEGRGVVVVMMGMGFWIRGFKALEGTKLKRVDGARETVKVRVTRLLFRIPLAVLKKYLNSIKRNLIEKLNYLSIIY